ncbi:MAG: hypothetical protein Fur002_00800 [Anaerolineales bacterium]
MSKEFDIELRIMRVLREHQKITYALLDRDLRISELAPNFTSFLRDSKAQVGMPVSETLDALIGADQSLRDVFDGKQNKYQIEYIDLTPPKKPPRYISLYICPDSAHLDDRLLLIIVDVTSLAIVEQHAVQTRNVLQLLRDRLVVKNAILRRQAFYDTLTNLPNRKYFTQALHQYISITNRRKTPCALMMIDIDDFKVVNDTLGHQVGDKKLQEVATVISQSIRETDFAARYGGEEFCVITPSVNAAEAQQVAERIQSELAKKCATTVSIGIVDYLPQENSDEFIQRADQAMYSAKRSGKNCIRLNSQST